MATLVVTAANLAAGGTIDLFLDTDKNSSTGSVSGAEYYFEIWQTSDDGGWDAEHWSGTDWQQVPESPTERFNRSGNVFTWTFSKADIGGVTGFVFWAASYMIDDSDNLLGLDFAPDGGDWTYDFTKSAVIVPAIGKPFAVPAHPSAGKLLSLSFPVIRADTGARLTGGALVAKTTIGGHPVPNVATLSNATANVAVQIPKSANGKTLQVKITIRLAGKSATRTISYTVRK